MRDRYVIRSRYYVLWSGDTGFVLLGMVAGVLFIALVHLTSDEIPLGLAIPSALLWIFLMGVLGHAPYRDLGIVRSYVVFQIDEEGIFFGTDPAQLVPWSRVTRIVLHRTGTGKGGTTQDVAVSMISLENGEPSPDGASEVRRVTHVLHRRIRAAVENFAPHVPVRSSDPDQDMSRGSGSR